MNGLTPSQRLIVALDVCGLDEALALIRLLRGKVDFFKVGLGLFTRVGPAGIRRLKEERIRLFLDLKFHDIPAVVREASVAATAMGADMFTIHASGGSAMMEAAAEGARETASSEGFPLPLVLGVTVLTSLDRKDLADLGYPGEVSERVRAWARLAEKAGLGGLVASAREAAMLREAVGPGMVIVTPGIRPSGSEVSDQKRVVTPAAALAAGADYLVVGRPITGSPDPQAAVSAILRELAAV